MNDMADDNQEIVDSANLQTVIIDSSDADKTVVCADGTNLYLCWKCKKAFTELPDFVVHKEMQCEGEGEEEEGDQEMAVELVDSQSFITLNVDEGDGQQFVIDEQQYQQEAVEQEQEQFEQNAIAAADGQQTQGILHVYTTDGEELNILNIQNADGEGPQAIEIPPGYTIVEDSGAVEPSAEGDEAKVEIISTRGTEVVSSKTILGTVDEVTNAILSSTNDLVPVEMKEQSTEQPAEERELLPENIQEVPLDDNTNLHYMCSVCGARYLDESSCRAHMEDHYDENLPDEDYLKKREKAARFAKHQRKFKRTAGRSIGATLFKKLTAVKSNVKCDECGKIYISETRLKQHQKVHTDAKPYECNVCLRKFRTISYLKNHMHTHLTEKTQQCPHCDKTYKTFNDLRYHKRVKHGYMKSQKCPICANKFVIEAVFIKHLKMHLSEITYECKICHKIFSSNYYLSIHKKSHSGDKITADVSGSPCHIHTHGCSKCNKRFSSEENLKVHIIMHNEAKPYKCVCGKTFKEGHKYRSHAVSSCNVDVSSIQPRFNCSVCPKSFYSAYHQSKHEETHLKKREMIDVCQVCEQYSPNTYVCMHCQQEFDSKDYYSIHLLLHNLGAGNPMDPTVETFDKKVNPFTGKEVYQCHFCREQFDELEHAVLHEKSHNVNLTCKFCSITYATKKNLMKHLRGVHGMTDDKENDGSVIKQADIKNESRADSDDNTPCSSPSQNDESAYAKKTLEMSGENGMLLKSTLASGENTDLITPIPLSTKIKRTAICDICKVRFASKLTLVNHIRDEHSDHPIAKDLLVNGIECNLCLKHYPTRYDLVKHKNKKHKWDSELGDSEDFYCELCRKVYMTRHSLSIHIFRKHEGGEFIQNRPHACTLCEKAFVTKSGLRKHLRFTHDIGFGEPCPGMEKDNSETSKIKECPVCSKVYTNMPDLKQHILKKHPDDYAVLLLLQENADFECSSCSVVFTSRSEFIEHVKEEHPDLKLTSLISNELIHCEECTKVFYDKKHYERHAKSHRSEVVMCNICYSTHKRPNTLKLHMKKYHPDICGKDMTDKRGEDEDGTEEEEGKVKIKEEINPDNHFVCEMCGLFFTSKIVLKRHLNQKHVKDCKHICSYCARGFASREACNKHEKRHKLLENPLFEDTVKPVLSKEQREAIRNQPIECTICNKSFIGKKRFRIHLQKSHPVLPLVRCECCDTLVENLEGHTCVAKSDDETNDSLEDQFIVDEALIEGITFGEIKSHGIDETNEYLCEKCEEVFPSEEKYLIHSKGSCKMLQVKTETSDNSKQTVSDVFSFTSEDKNRCIQSDTIKISPKQSSTSNYAINPDLQDSLDRKKEKEAFLMQTNLSPSTPKSSSDSEGLDRKSRHSRAKKDFSLYYTPDKQSPRSTGLQSKPSDATLSSLKKNTGKKNALSIQNKQNTPESKSSTSIDIGTNKSVDKKNSLDANNKNKLGEEVLSDEGKSLPVSTAETSTMSDRSEKTVSTKKTPSVTLDKKETPIRQSNLQSFTSKLTPSGDCKLNIMKKTPIVLLDRLKTPPKQTRSVSHVSSSAAIMGNETKNMEGTNATKKNKNALLQNSAQGKTKSRFTSSVSVHSSRQEESDVKKESLVKAENNEKQRDKLPSKPEYIPRAQTLPISAGSTSVTPQCEGNVDDEVSKIKKDLSMSENRSDISEKSKRDEVSSKSTISSSKRKSICDDESKSRKRKASKEKIENGFSSKSKLLKQSDKTQSTSEADSSFSFHCKICDKGFLSNRLYLRHMTIHDKKKKKPEQVSEYQKVYIIK